MQNLSLEEVHIDELLNHVLDGGQIELYLEIAHPPRTRSYNAAMLQSVSQYEHLRAPVLYRLVTDVLRDDQIARLDQDKATTLRYGMADNSAHFQIVAAVRNDALSVVCHLVAKI